MTHRVDKVSAQLREEVSEIIARRLKDPRLGLVTVVDVDVSPDLSNARIRVSNIGDELEREAMMAALEHARGFIRHELAVRLKTLRRIPELRFFDDRNTEYAVHIGQMLEQLKEKDG